MREILFREGPQMFSFRVAGILLRGGKILLQRPVDDDGYSLPEGHVEFGEIGAETLVREFREETGADIVVHELKWVGEVTFPWGQRTCQQIGLYYRVELLDAAQLPPGDFFLGEEKMEDGVAPLAFHWAPLTELHALRVYPCKIATLMQHWDDGVQHFVER